MSMIVKLWLIEVLLMHFSSGLASKTITGVKSICTGVPTKEQGQTCAELISCPPGYLQNSTGKCNCSAGTSSGYYGIEKCDLELQRAYIDQNYWIGYDSNENESEDSLLSGYCPKSFCSPQHGYLLPSVASRALLQDAICAPNRTGVLCGTCQPNYSARYHSLTLKCEPDVHCKLGWVFYIISEIVPVTVIFIVIILCNISFTSGLANSFLFYSQTVKMLHVRAGNLIRVSLVALYLEKIYQFAYFFLNLDPFVLDEIAYCISKHATSLDVFSFSNITATYSFFLMVLVVLVSSKCSTSQQPQGHRRSKKLKVQGNIIHGLSSFLLLFTSRCAHNSILILGYIDIYGKGYQKRKTVVRYNGEIEWMSLDHLPYAIPAIILLVIVSIPPIVLIIYPLHYRVLSILNVAESSCVRCFFNPLERLKPFLDSFQGCYKDNFRFFSGLFFVYRILVSLIIAAMKPADAYFSVSVLLTLLLVLHAVSQPYIRRLHNTIDVLLLCNLLLINMITAYNVDKTKSVNTAELSLTISVTSWIQMILIFASLVCLVGRFVPLKKVIRKLKCHFNASNSVEIPDSIEYGTFSDRYK